MPDTLHELQAVLVQRRADRPQGSYSASLFADRERLVRKIMEEAFELCLELGRPEISEDHVAAEAADLMFHTVVGLVAVGVDIDRVLDVLRSRRR